MFLKGLYFNIWVCVCTPANGVILGFRDEFYWTSLFDAEYWLLFQRGISATPDIFIWSIYHCSCQWSRPQIITQCSDVNMGFNSLKTHTRPICHVVCDSWRLLWLGMGHESLGPSDITIVKYNTMQPYMFYGLYFIYIVSPISHLLLNRQRWQAWHCPNDISRDDINYSYFLYTQSKSSNHAKCKYVLIYQMVFICETSNNCMWLWHLKFCDLFVNAAFSLGSVKLSSQAWKRLKILKMR